MRSQVLPYLRALGSGARIHLLTFEPAHAPGPPPPREIGDIRHHRLTYHKRPRLIAKMVDALAGVLVASWIVLYYDLRVIHARSHVSAAIAAVTAMITRRPWIFDMRGFLGDEFTEAGNWARGSPTDRLARAAERIFLRRSDAVVVLTERARDRLRADSRYRSAVRGREIVLVPCCVELDRFKEGTPQRENVLVYVGSVGTWYLLDDMLRFFSALRAFRSSFRMLFLNQGQHAQILAAAQRLGVSTFVDLRSADFAEVPTLLGRCAAGIVLLHEGVAKVGSSPIKVGEYLAAGLPVVANRIVGDVPAQLELTQAGVVVEGLDHESLNRSARRLLALLDEGQPVRERARRLAAQAYSVRDGAQRYADLYDALAGVPD